MAKGKEKHQARLDAIGLLGKDLARRAGRKCELCTEGGSLRPLDTRPDEEPALPNLALLCDRCRRLADGEAQPAETLRFLEGAIWSDIPAVAEIARAALRRVDAGWARAALELVS